MTLGEAAAYLKFGERTIHRMIQRSEIPCARVGGQWRFLKSVLDDWLLSRMQVLPRNEVAPLLGMADSSLQLSSSIDPRFVVDPVVPGAMREVLTQLVKPLADHGVIADVAKFVDLLAQREMLSRVRRLQVPRRADVAGRCRSSPRAAPAGQSGHRTCRGPRHLPGRRPVRDK